MKAFLGVDTHRTFFLWEESVVKEINPTLDMLDIPDDLFQEYIRVSAAYQNLQDTLKNLHLKNQT